MGSVEEYDISSREKECMRDYMESKSSKSRKLRSIPGIEVENGLLKDEPELQDLELGNKLLKDQPTKEDLMLKNRVNQFDKALKEIKRTLQRLIQEKPGIEQTLMTERRKFLIRTLDDLNSGKSKRDKATSGQLDADSASRYAQLSERFTSLNLLSLTKDIPDDFKIYIDCKEFKSNELKVIVKGGKVSVRGKHDVKLDKHGLIKREFSRCWSIPEDVEQEKISCLLDRHGILTILAPRKASSFTIPIQAEKPRDSKSRQI